MRRHGAPSSILTDQGGEFNNHLLGTLSALCGIKRMMATTKKSSTNGLTERFNWTLVGMLKRYVNVTRDDWDKHIPACLLAYRACRQDSMGTSPYELLYGRRARLRVDVAMSERPPIPMTDYNRVIRMELGPEYVDFQTRLLAEERDYHRNLLREQAQHHLKLRQDAMKERWKQVARHYNIQIGQPLYIVKEAQLDRKGNKKFRHQWKGTCIVLGVLPRGNLLLRKFNEPRAPTITWHVTNVRPVKTSTRLREKGVYNLADHVIGMAPFYFLPFGHVPDKE